MLDGLRGRYRALVRRLRRVERRLRRVERREVREFRRWIEHTANLIHLSILLFVPLVISAVTAVSNSVDLLPFVLFPPLASGTFTLFADPEGEYASPTAFVGGLTAGAVCGTVAVWVGVRAGLRDSLGGTVLAVSPAEAALAVFLTGVVTWAFDFEQPAAFSTALLALIAPAFGDPATVGLFFVQFVGSVFVASSLVAAAFRIWQTKFYERRSQFLYASTRGDDRVLVPMRGDRASATATFGARLAAAHDASKVVLLDVVGDGHATEVAADESADRLEAEADRIETEVGVPCEVVVAGDGTDPSATVRRTARETNCDLVVTPYEEERGSLSPFVRGLFRGDVDAVAFRSSPDSEPRSGWNRVLVPVRRAGDTAHLMIDFARRLADRVSVCTCIDSEAERRSTEATLANLVETFEGSFETRVSRTAIESFLEANDAYYDLVVMGASTDRSAASRFVSPPTFERLHELECDVAVVHRA